jgi:hypothetical protein
MTPVGTASLPIHRYFEAFKRHDLEGVMGLLQSLFML